MAKGIVFQEQASDPMSGSQVGLYAGNAAGANEANWRRDDGTIIDLASVAVGSPLTTKGDIWGYAAADARVPVGANGTVLGADSAAALGVAYIPKGTLLQARIASTGASSTIATVIPFDDTQPLQASEGAQVLSVSITPKLSTSTLVISAGLCGSTDGGNSFVGYICVDSGNGICVGAAGDGAQVMNTLQLHATHAPGSTSAVVVKLFGGPQAGETFRYNGHSGSRQFGGFMLSWIKVEEVQN